MRALNRYDAWKLFALVAMTFDHVGYYLVGDEEIWRMVGRLAMPVFCFLVGFNRHYRWRPELFLVALCLSFAEAAQGRFWVQNILWGILLARLLLQAVEEERWKQWVLPVIFLCTVAFPFTRVFIDYGSLTLLWALAGRFAASDRTAWQGKAYMVSAMALTVLLTWDVFVVTHLYGYVTTVALVVMGYALWQVSYAPWHVRGRAATMARFFSDHALYYYGVHLLLLSAAGIVLGIKP